MLLQKVFLQPRVLLVLVRVSHGGKTQLDHLLAEGGTATSKRSHSSQIRFAWNLNSMYANHPAALSAQNGDSVMLALFAITC
jgi:hypothetical protein